MARRRLPKLTWSRTWRRWAVKSYHFTYLAFVKFAEGDEERLRTEVERLANSEEDAEEGSGGGGGRRVREGEEEGEGEGAEEGEAEWGGRAQQPVGFFGATPLLGSQVAKNPRQRIPVPRAPGRATT